MVSTNPKVYFLFFIESSLILFILWRILSGVGIENQLSLICTFGLAESFTPDAFSDTTLFVIQAGDWHREFDGIFILCKYLQAVSI